MRLHTKQRNQAGFTIVELMIATAILSTILVLVTVMMISIGNLYYKGINQARIQDDVRSIADDLSQHLELNDRPPTTPAPPLPTFGGGTTVNAYCINTTRYSYVIGAQVDHQYPGGGSIFQHVLWRDTITAGTCTPANLTATDPSVGTGGSNGTELIAPNSRLIAFCVTGVDIIGNPEPACIPGNSPFNISVSVAYSDDDLLCSPSAPGATCNTAATMNPAYFKNGDLLCKGHIGDQFCATANLTTAVAQRIN